MADVAQTPVTRAPSRGLRPSVAVALVLAAIALRGPGLDGPFTDGLRGDCGAFFSIMARNARALGLARTLGVPVINPVPPQADAGIEWYTHHPPGLPLLVTLASTVPVTIEVAARGVALALGLASLLLVADLLARTLGSRAALAGGLAMLLLPAGIHHGLLVNYETIAMPATLLLVRALALGTPRGALAAGVLAAWADWIALLALVVTPPLRLDRRRAGALAGAVLGLLALVLLQRTRVSGSLTETLGHAVGATPLAPDFSAAAWIAALGAHGWALFAPCLLALPLGIWRARRDPPPVPLRRAFTALLLVALLDVVLFARHATGHEVYALLFLPPLALLLGWIAAPASPRAAGTASTSPPSRAAGAPGTSPRTRAAALATLALVLAASVVQARADAPARAGTRQARLAAAFARVTTLDAVYLSPRGAPLVFLHRAARHVSPYGASDREGALRELERLRARHALGPRAGFVFAPEDEPWPPWMGAAPAPRGGFRIAPLAAPDG